MAVMTAPEQARVVAQFMREGRAVLGPTAYTQPELVAAAAATAQWIEDNRAAYNTALPVAFRTKATTGQKALLLMVMIAREQGRYRAEED